MKYFCIIKENIAHMECAIQKSIFYSFYLFLSILLCNVDSALVLDWNAYIWISNCIQMFELYSNVRIYIMYGVSRARIACCWWRLDPGGHNSIAFSKMFQSNYFLENFWENVSA